MKSTAGKNRRLLLHKFRTMLSARAGRPAPFRGRDESAQRGAPTCLRVSSVAALVFRFQS